MATTTLANLQNVQNNIAPVPNTNVNLDTVAGFESLQRIAKLFSCSSIVPKQYQGKIADCFIAVDMALRMGANPLMVFQNLYSVHGSPAWSAQFLIATFNKCGRFSSLRYEFQGKEGHDDWGCRAVSTELATKEKLVSPIITIGMAKKEGWYGKTGSKWQTMPEMMLRYRAAAWFVRTYAPEIAMGLQTAEEVHDATITVNPEITLTIDELQNQPVNTETGEVIQTAGISQDAKPVNRQQENPEPARPPKNSGRQKQETRPEKPQKPQQEPTETENPVAEPEHEPEYNPPESVRIVEAHGQGNMPELEYFECAKPQKDGSPRMVTDDDCLRCFERSKCTVWAGVV